MLRFAFSILCLLACSSGWASDEGYQCAFGEMREDAKPRTVAGYVIRVQAIPEGQRKDGADCRVTISRAGRVLFTAEESHMDINDATGQDINGDGMPDAVLEGYSGGAHCCWTYWIVSLTNPPHLLKTLYNEHSISFELAPGNGIELVTSDGAFDYFDDLPYSNSPKALVFLQLQGRRLVSKNTGHWIDYQKAISEARKRLTAEKLSAFRALTGPEAHFDSEVAKAVLEIVLCYLYAGKAVDAWKALGEMWPPSDVSRISELVEQARRRGILKQASIR